MVALSEATVEVAKAVEFVGDHEKFSFHALIAVSFVHEWR